MPDCVLINLFFICLYLKEIQNQVVGVTLLFVIYIFIGCLFISIFLLIAAHKIQTFMSILLFGGGVGFGSSGTKGPSAKPVLKLFKS